MRILPAAIVALSVCIRRRCTLWCYKSPSSHLQLLLAHTENYAIGPLIPVVNFSTGKGNYPVHFLRHFFYTKEGEYLAGCHVAETCPHVFISPSTILPVIYVNP
jgi:hypothetical protein